MNRNLTRLFLAAIALGGLLVGFASAEASAATRPAASKAARAATKVSPSMDAETFEAQVLRNVNKQRKAHHLPALRTDRCTDDLAESWGRFLAAGLQFFHQDMNRVLSRCNATYAGETLAKGAVSPRKIVSMWMHSPGHRAIVLSKSPRRIGVAAVADATGQWVVTADYTRF
jgi:uncharacterized protein YkwD